MGKGQEEFSAELSKEVAQLEAINSKPFFGKLAGYAKFMGPASMEAATTLGAGSFTAAVMMGASNGYSMLWVPFYSYLFGLFMLHLGAKFAIYRRDSVIEMQNTYHTKVVGSFATGLVACFLAMVVFSFGQYALGTDALASGLKLIHIDFPRKYNWSLILAISAGLSLLYGKSHKLVRLVEKSMQVMIGIMLVTFLAVVLKTGVNFGAMIKGLLVPTLPRGVEGITMAVAGLTAAMGVGDWVQYHYAAKTRNYTPAHEGLSIFDTVFGGLVPVTLVLSFIGIAFAETFSGKSGIPEKAVDLANALVVVLPSVWVKVGFYLGIIAIVVSTMVGMSILAAQSLCHALNLPEDPKKFYWKLGLLLPQLGFLGAFFGKPLWAVIIAAALQSLFNWLSGFSWYLLANDSRAMGKHVVKHYLVNLGIIVSVVALNLAFITFVLTEMGV
ncbi:MAG: divalent metal cation transporter [Synergistales bacterium]|jgi:Mn2+/Fe2+ NRAMP family transporter